MKAVILEKRDGYSAVLREDGVIEKLKIHGEVGDTIFLDPEKRKKKAGIYRFAQAAAAAMLFLIAGLSARYYVFSPSSYVTMDVNPSVEFSMNRLNRVIEVEAVNEDADEIVASLKENRIWGCSLEEILEQTTQILEEYEYLSDSDTAILFAVSAENDASYEEIEATVREAESSRAGVSVEIVRGGPKDRDSAKKFSLSLGRYLKMMENESGDGASAADGEKSESYEPDDKTVTEYREMPVSDMLGRGNAEISPEMNSENGTGSEAGIQSGAQGDEKPETSEGAEGSRSEDRTAAAEGQNGGQAGVGTEGENGQPGAGTEGGENAQPGAGTENRGSEQPGIGSEEHTGADAENREFPGNGDMTAAQPGGEAAATAGGSPAARTEGGTDAGADGADVRQGQATVGKQDVQ